MEKLGKEAAARVSARTSASRISARLRAVVEQRMMDDSITMRDIIERVTLAALWEHLVTRGFTVKAVVRAGEDVAVDTLDDALRETYEAGQALWLVRALGYGPHRILLVPGNGIDIVSDWSYFDNDSDRFNAVMDAFIEDLSEQG